MTQSRSMEGGFGCFGPLVLSDGQWEKIAPLIIGRPDQKGSTGRDNRMFVEGVPWIVRTGSPWRDLPDTFGEWNSVFRRFSRWSEKGVWWRVFAAMRARWLRDRRGDTSCRRRRCRGGRPGRVPPGETAPRRMRMAAVAGRRTGGAASERPSGPLSSSRARRRAPGPSRPRRRAVNPPRAGRRG